jgi:predicted nucleic acid-binding protein
MVLLRTNGRKTEDDADKKDVKETVAVFVDANVFLSLYAYSNDDLEKVLSVRTLISSKLIQVYEPDQVFSEISRNREVKIIEAINEFSKEKLSARLPILMRDFANAERFNATCRALERLRNDLISNARDQAANRTLPADTVLEELLATTVRIPVTDKIYLAALRRNREGNPPGKASTIGDELNWEALLANCPDGMDLHIVSKDGDYRSPLDKSKPREFLAREWEERKKAKLFLHSELGPFLGSLDDAIKLAGEDKKAKLIDALVNSRSFASTHYAIAELKPYAPILTIDDVEAIVRGAVANAQVHWIRGDEDVKDFFETILKGNLARLDPELAKEARASLLVDNDDQDRDAELQKLFEELAIKK